MSPGTPTPINHDSTRIHILGLRIDNLTMDAALDAILLALESPGPSHICFINAHNANVSAKDAAYRALLARSALTFADGIGLKLAGKILGREIRDNVNGTDLFPLLCARMTARPESIFLLGGHPGIAEAVADWIARTHPGVRIAGHRPGFFRPEEVPAICAQVRESGAAMLVVALGTPLQEKLLDAHLAATGARVGIGVGGLFDFLSGRRERAPQWMRSTGLEWFYRFMQEPGRMWKRYFVGNFTFLGRVLAEKFLGRVPSPKGPAS